MLSRGLHTLADEIKDRMKRRERVTPEVLAAIACVIEAAALEAAALEGRTQSSIARITQADLAANIVLFPGVELPRDDVETSRTSCGTPSGRDVPVNL